MLQTHQELPTRAKAHDVTQDVANTAPGDHAFPMLEAGVLEIPPFFRFMWASR